MSSLRHGLMLKYASNILFHKENKLHIYEQKGSKLQLKK